MSADRAGGMLWLVAARDLRLAGRRRMDAALPVAFFVLAASLFPLGVGAEPDRLRQIGPGVVWVCALLATLVSLPALFAGDLADGSLDQMLLPGRPVVMLAAGKALAHWLLTGLPLLLAAPLIGVMFDLSAPAIAVLVAALALGTPVLSLLGGMAAALTLGLRNAGLLTLLLVLPLCIPVLVFGSGAVVMAEAGLSAQGHLSLLAALLLLSIVGLPPATAAALRMAVG